MIFLLIFSPLITLGELGLGLGYLLDKFVLDEIEGEYDDRLIAISSSTLGLSLLPFLLVALAVVFPVVLICRLYQIFKLFFCNIAGQCFRKIFCCCCY